MAITPPNIYVRSTDGSDASDGGTWADAKATVAGAAAIDTTGNNRIWVSQSHNESLGSDQAWSFAGTAAAPTWVVAVNDGAEPPTAVSTATCTTTGGFSQTISGNCYLYGLTINAGTGAVNSHIYLGSNAQEQTFDTCTLNVPGTGGNANIGIGSTANDQPARIVWSNVNVSFGASAGGIVFAMGSLEWDGGTVGTSPDLTSGFIRPNSAGEYIKARISGVDLTEVGITGYLCAKTSLSRLDVEFRNCKIPAFTTGDIVTGTLEAGDRVALYNCDSSDTNYRIWIKDQWGSTVSDTGVSNDAGADDGSAQAFSWKMVSTANTEFPHQVLVSPEIVKWNDTTTGTLTATVEIVHNSQGSGTSGALRDHEIWLEIMCMDPGGTPVGKWQSDRCANLNLNSNAADQTSSSATWTGDAAGWDTQKLVVSFTPKEKGYVHARICLAKASATVYVDPLLTIA